MALTLGFTSLDCAPCLAWPLLRWALLRGTSVVPKSVTPPRIRENAAAMRPQLAGPGQIGEEVALATLDSALAQARRVTGAYFVGKGARHGFASLEDLWDE